jgi:gas vesicle protein
MPRCCYSKMMDPTKPTELGSYEGKYPKDLFKKTVLVNEHPIGHVAKETDDLIVVFSDTDTSIRFDIPKSEIVLAGGSVVANQDLLFRYRKQRDEAMPPDRSLRPSGEEIRAAAAQQLEVEEKRRTTPDAIMEERNYLATQPRPETAVASTPEGYLDTESELSKKIKRALAELREIIVAGSKVAKKKAKEAQLQAEEKQAEMDAEAISRMGDLSSKFADSFEEVLSEIRTRTYADQEQIYTGFLKLMNTQRELIVARRDLARKLKDSVSVPVVVDKPKVDASQGLAEHINESRTLDDRTITAKRKSKRRKMIRKRKRKS